MDTLISTVAQFLPILVPVAAAAIWLTLSRPAKVGLAVQAVLVMLYRRKLGAVLLAASVIAGAARVAAHVHHAQDIIGALLIAVVAVAVVSAVWHCAQPRLPARIARFAGRTPQPRA